MKISNKNIFSFIFIFVMIFSFNCYSQDLSHRKSDLKLTVTDQYGTPIPNAVIDIQMKKHAFKYGTQVRDQFFSITENSFNALSDNAKQNLLPDLSGMSVVSSSFDASIGNWQQFGGANLSLTSSEYFEGVKSLYISNRSYNYSSPRLYLDQLITNNGTYRFSVAVKLAAGENGQVGLTIKRVDGSGTNWINFPRVDASDQDWVQIIGDYNHNPVGEVTQFFVYVTGPNSEEGMGNYYVDDFSIETNPVRYTPTWQDILNYRDTVKDNFNHAIPTTGLQWHSIDNKGYAIPDAAVNLLNDYGLSVTGASVVWPRDRWPTPNRFLPGSNPSPYVFHSTLVNDRLSQAGIIGRYSVNGSGPNISEWKILNEPINNNYYQSTFVNAGIYSTQNSALANFFERANTVRPDAILSINEYNIINSNSDTKAIEYRNFINNLLALGAPIDRIGIQAHMSWDVSKADITRRINILAETGLPIEITEFDSRDDAGQLTNQQQEDLLRNMLEASFENPSVVGFIMWGFWDPGHWRGNGPLYDIDWNLKQEASPWFDLVRNAWTTNLEDQSLDSLGEWNSQDGVFNGIYDFVVTINGVSTIFESYDVTSNSEYVLAIDYGNNIPVLSFWWMIIMAVLISSIHTLSLIKKTS
jgi:GH35 family endo-1,4-beta-xylanase